VREVGGYLERVVGTRRRIAGGVRCHRFNPRTSGSREGEKMSKSTIRQDLEEHPELSPILDISRAGEVVCLGWVTPIFTWPDTQELERETNETL
jgi:hypothetical protein